MNRCALLCLAFSLIAASASAQTTLYRRPFESARVITAGFDTNGGAGGCADYACAGRCYDGHTGTDFGLPVGTQVLAGAKGRVITVVTGCPDTGYYCSSCGGLCGNHIRIEHADGSRTLYCHMQSGGMRVSVGDNVECGQLIGHSASSGCSTGPHLHFGFYASASAAADDPFRGDCGGPVTRWVDQGSYSSIPGTACQCQASTEVCNGVDDDCDGSADEGEVCEIGLLQDQPAAYAPARTTDVNGDGLADLCARASDGFHCWPASSSGGWDASWTPIPWADEHGWNDITNYATIRMGDINGDGFADACARGNAGVYCATSTGTDFNEHAVWIEGLTDEGSWNNPQYYTTLRLADVDGDGMDDLCARSSRGFECWISTGTSFGTHIDGPVWSNENGWNKTKHYGTIRMGDLNGDGRADVCARSTAGVECWLSDGAGFPTAVDGPDWAGGSWGEMSHWSTIRLLDFDGDGLGDLCARVDSDMLTCVRGTGSGFEAPIEVGDLSSGWDDRSNFATLRVGDLDGDGGDDLCIRANARALCWLWDGAAWTRFDGPEWSDEGGWNSARYYETMRIADVDGDGDGDLCARAAAGWRCHPSAGGSFEAALTSELLTNDGGWGEHRFWSTIRTAGYGCRAKPETCNGIDDDCDGEIDNDPSCVEETPDAGVDAGRDAGDAADAATSADGGVDPTLSAGCACRAASPRSGNAPLWLLLSVALGATWRRRRRAG